MLDLEILILKLGAVDALTTRPIAGCEVAALDHELLDHAVEKGALVVQWLAGFALALFTGTEGAKVLCRLGDDIVVQLEGDAALGDIANGNVKVDTMAGCCVGHDGVVYWIIGTMSMRIGKDDC